MSATGGVGDVGIVSLVGFGSSVGIVVIVGIGTVVGGNSVSLFSPQLDSSNMPMENVMTICPNGTAMAHVLRGVTVGGSTP